jgi:hypothetical protein
MIKPGRRSDDAGVCLTIGAAASTLTLLAAAALEAATTRVFLLLALVVAGTSLRSTSAVGAGIGALAWGLFTGFLLHRFGELSFGPDDVARLVLLVGVGALTAVATGPGLPLRTRDRRR